MGLIDNVNVNVGGNGNIIDTLSTYVTKVLKPNIINGKNILSQDMMPIDTGANTKYVIKYNYELNENIIVPANCVLDFDGGSISNGTIEGNNTLIYAGEKKGILKNIILDGTFANSTYYLNWFLDSTNITTPLKRILAITNVYGGTILLSKGIYTLSEPIVVNRITTIKTLAKVLIGYTGTSSDPAITITGDSELFTASSTSNIIDGTIGGLYIIGSSPYSNCACLYLDGGTGRLFDHRITGVEIRYFKYGIHLSNNKMFMISFSDIRVWYCYNAIITDEYISSQDAGENICFNDCYFSNLYDYAIINKNPLFDITFTNCSFDYINGLIKSLTIPNDINFIGGHFEGLDDGADSSFDNTKGIIWWETSSEQGIWQRGVVNIESARFFLGTKNAPLIKNTYAIINIRNCGIYRNPYSTPYIEGRMLVDYGIIGEYINNKVFYRERTDILPNPNNIIKLYPNSNTRLFDKTFYNVSGADNLSRLSIATFDNKDCLKFSTTTTQNFTFNLLYKGIFDVSQKPIIAANVEVGASAVCRSQFQMLVYYFDKEFNYISNEEKALYYNRNNVWTNSEESYVGKLVSMSHSAECTYPDNAAYALVGLSIFADTLNVDMYLRTLYIFNSLGDELKTIPIDYENGKVMDGILSRGYIATSNYSVTRI